MTRLAVQAELLKLAQVLNIPVEQLHFVEALQPETLRTLRFAILEQIQKQQKPIFRRIAAWISWLPARFNRFVISYWLDPYLVAKIGEHLAVDQLHRIAKKLSPSVLASISVYLDPRIARELLDLFETKKIVDITHELLNRRDFITMGRFVGYLSDTTVQQVAEIVKKESDLLEIAFFIESHERIDHLVHVLPRERIERALFLICDFTQRPVWPKLLALMSNIGYGLKQELGDLAVKQGDSVINAIIQATQEDQIWEDMLPVVACLSPEAQHHVANLPALRQVEIIKSIIEAVDRCGLWADMLVVVSYMKDAAREVVANAIVDFDASILRNIIYATLMRSQWHATLDIIRRLSKTKQAECLKILSEYMQDLDEETHQYLKTLMLKYQLTIINTTVN